MPVEVIGRDDDLRSLYAQLRRGAARGPSAIALEGEAGIGKSTLWAAAVEAARGQGLRVLSSRPAESERALAYAGLGDLLDGALGEVLPALTPPRRRALEVALLVEDAAGRPVDARALGVAVRSALQLLAEDGLVVAIDDLQWLDASSASVLGFALRRLPDSALLLVWTRRLGDGEESSAVEDALDADRIEHVRVGPLSAGAIQQLLRDRLSRTVPRPTLLRLHEASGGNPFYALELARALGAEGAVRDPTQPLPVPERLEELVSTRLDGFTGGTREALVLASAHPRLTVPELRSLGIERSALDPALGENVLELERDTVRFTHPLLASVLYQGLSADERQRAHRRLAELAGDGLARARHLALSVDRPDPELAAVLEQAAAAAAAQGAPIAAGELGEHALRLTPAETRADADRRAMATARLHLAAGEVERARVLAGDLVARASAGTERAEALVLLAEIESEAPQRAIPLLQEALPDAEAPAGSGGFDPPAAEPARPLHGGTRGCRAARARVGGARGPARRRRPPRCGDGRPRAHPLQRGQSRGAPARRAGVRARAGRRLSARGRRRLLSRDTFSSGRTTSSGRGSCSRASTGTGASPTSAWPPMRSGTWRSSSFARATSRWRATTRSRRGT